ncbi:hypothetical protein H6G18_05310 [Anabaena subtropica FACHB-260]|uniref:Uncharacterized protein n=1 Tax=Anabaena subtropica FACHB-260 TaxID=2692884 RepID=A0ABR8CL33_9NOST|nr:hypothetical protein [Anabaena subtropica FACHB-260]
MPFTVVFGDFASGAVTGDYILTQSTVAISNFPAMTSGKAMPPAVDIFKVFLLDPSSQHETLR